jgi:uncharacterized membrane protein
MVDERRVEELELRVERLARRVRRIEAGEECSTAVSNPWPAPERNRPPRPTEPPAAPAAPVPSVAAATQPAYRLQIPGLEEVLRGRTIEDLLGGRVLAWVGGLAVLLGIVFLFAVAVSSGWIGEGARTLLGGAGSAALLTLGIWLHERRGRTDAALAAVAAGMSGLFVTLTVGAQVYEVLPPLAALALAIGVGALATALALRWEAEGIAALGILGALLSPALAGAPYDLLTMAILLVAASSAVGVLLGQRWEWLSLGVFVVTVPQWAAYLVHAQSAPEALCVLAGFGAIGVAAAAGYELRASASKLGHHSAFLLCLNAIVVSVAGYAVCTKLGHESIATAWLWAAAATHMAVGLVAGRREAGVHDFGLVALTIGTLLADAAFALTVDGPLRTVGFAGAGVAFAALVRSRNMGRADEALMTLGLGVHLTLALMQTLMVDAPPGDLFGGGLSAAAGASLLALAAGCFVSARLAQSGRRELRMALDVLGLSATAYLTALSLDGMALVIAWSCEAVALARVARREQDRLADWGALAHLGLAGVHILAWVAPLEALVTDVPLGKVDAAAALGAVAAASAAIAAFGPKRSQEARATLELSAVLALSYLSVLLLDGLLLVLVWSAGAVALIELSRRLRSQPLAVAGLAHVGAALVHALCFEAPPASLVEGLAAPGVAALALGAIALAGIHCVRGESLARHRAALGGAVAVTLLYLASALVVTSFQAGAPAQEAGLLELDVRQQGQVALSALWALVGLGSLVVGLRRDRRAIRLGALALLVASVGKVFMFDLATLTSIYRVISFIVLGLLLLTGAFVWQRLRPGPVPDMREVPAGIR